MFERFTERARQVITLAEDEARTLRQPYVGTEHLLLGLLREEEGLAARVLDALDIHLDAARAFVAEVGENGVALTGKIPLTLRARKVCELGLREALSLGHNYIGTEHLLLGLARENEGVACRYLLKRDVDAEKIRNEVIRRLSGSSRRSAITPEPDPDPPALAFAYALEAIVATLGPTVDCPHIACQGCLAEMSEALRIAKEALA